MKHSQNIYEYNKIKILEQDQVLDAWNHDPSTKRMIVRLLNKINELVIEQNHLMKDFELYKKAFKDHVSSTS